MKHMFCCALYILVITTVVLRQVVLLFVNTQFRHDQFQSGDVSGLISFNSMLQGEELDKTQGIYSDVAFIPQN